LNAQQLNWLNTRPERLLTDKDSLMQRLAEPAPQLESWISARSRQRFTRLCDTLTALHIPFTHDRKLFPVNNYNDLILSGTLTPRIAINCYAGEDATIILPAS
jgi:histidyl-tRNA synthetase